MYQARSEFVRRRGTSCSLTSSCWTPANHTHGAPDLADTLLVETYDVRKVGAADAAFEDRGR